MNSVIHLALVFLFLIGVLVIDLAVLLGHNFPMLFAIPVLYVGLSRSPGLTVAVAALALGLYLVSVRLEPHPSPTWPLGFIGLTIIGYFATSMALSMERRDQQEQRYRQAVPLA